MSKTKFRRLYFDCETSPNIGFFWSAGYKLNISYDSIIQERAIICICYKWEDEKTVNYLTWNKGDDKKLVEDFYKIILQADEVVGHNSDNFDLPWFRTRCLFHGIKNLPIIKSIDTLKIAKSTFRFNSNKLDYIAKYLGLNGKIKTDFNLWRNIVLDNDNKALTKMVLYCQQDVRILQKVYEKLQGYTRHSTHVGVYMGKDKCSCSSCGSNNTRKDRLRITAAGYRQVQLQCNDCGKYFTIAETIYNKFR